MKDANAIPSDTSGSNFLPGPLSDHCADDDEHDDDEHDDDEHDAHHHDEDDKIPPYDNDDDEVGLVDKLINSDL